jgi:hypothetical protein
VGTARAAATAAETQDGAAQRRASEDAQESGVWDRALSALRVQANAEGRLDWEAHWVDATIVRAHWHAAGAKKSAGESPEIRAEAEALG